MTKNIFLSIIFSLFATTFVHSQTIHAHWKLSSKKVNDCEYDLIFTVSIDKGWHIPSVKNIPGAEGETFPTEIVFTPAKEYTLVGDLKETKPTTELDPTLNKNVLLHYNNATFTQRVKLNSGSKIKVEGTYKYQICDNVKCAFPPKDPFSFELQGTTGCKKK